jgi:hypothetical protein
MATSAATIAAAVVARARREVREHFETRNADSASRAVEYVAPDHIHQRQFDALVGRGILRATGDGRYWIDRAALRLAEERRRAALKTVLVIVAIGVVVAIGIAAVTIGLAGRG